MEPFYLLVFIAGLLVANLLLQLLKAATSGARGVFFTRRPCFLTAEERLCWSAIQEAASGDFDVLAKVALSAVLQADQDQPRRRRAKAAVVLQRATLDFLVCSAADGFPLCAVLVESDDQTRAAKQTVSVILDACASAGLPLIRLPLQDGYEVKEIRRRVLDAIESAEVRILQAPEPAAEDEEALLAELAASMQEPDGTHGRRLRGHR
jgi:hypothetical protein